MQITHGGGALRREIKTVTLTGANNLGELDAPTVSIFNVTGEVLVALLVPYCTVDLVSAGGGTLALGVVGSTALFVAATTATTINAADFWMDTTPDTNGQAVPAALKDIAVTDSICATVGTADITAGAITFMCYWMPLSSDGLLVAA